MCFHSLRVLYWAQNTQLLQGDHVLTYKNQVHKLIFWPEEKRHFPIKNRWQGRINIKGKRRWCLNYAQTCLRIWKNIAPRSNVLFFLSIWPSHRQFTKRRGSLRSYFEVASNECVPPPSPIFHTFTQESLPLYTGLMTSLLWLSLLFLMALQTSL